MNHRIADRFIKIDDQVNTCPHNGFEVTMLCLLLPEETAENNQGIGTAW